MGFFCSKNNVVEFEKKKIWICGPTEDNIQGALNAMIDSWIGANMCTDAFIKSMKKSGNGYDVTLFLVIDKEDPIY